MAFSEFRFDIGKVLFAEVDVFDDFFSTNLRLIVSRNTHAHYHVVIFGCRSRFFVVSSFQVVVFVLLGALNVILTVFPVSV